MGHATVHVCVTSPRNHAFPFPARGVVVPQLGSILTFATLGTLISTLLTGGVLYLLGQADVVARMSGEVGGHASVLGCDVLDYVCCVKRPVGMTCCATRCAPTVLGCLHIWTTGSTLVWRIDRCS